GKIEYLYLDLGTAAGGFPGINPFFLAYSSQVRDHIFRAGVNYKLGDPIYVAPAPRAVYKARPVAVGYDWSGVYVGGNLGPSVARNQTAHPIFIPTFGTDRSIISPSGAIGGVGIGVNWQMTPGLVWGAEADIQAAAQRDDNWCGLGCIAVPGQVTTFETF